MRENCLSGSEGGGPDRPVRPPYPYQAPHVTPAKAGVVRLKACLDREVQVPPR